MSQQESAARFSDFQGGREAGAVEDVASVMETHFLGGSAQVFWFTDNVSVSKRRSEHRLAPDVAF